MEIAFFAGGALSPGPLLLAGGLRATAPAAQRPEGHGADHPQLHAQGVGPQNMSKTMEKSRKVKKNQWKLLVE